MSITTSVIQNLLNVKKGWKTSEFWVTLIPALTYALSLLGVHLGNTQTTHLLIVVWGAVAAVYTLARSYLKSVHIGHAVSLVGLLNTIEKEALTVVKDISVGADAPTTTTTTVP